MSLSAVLLSSTLLSASAGITAAESLPTLKLNGPDTVSGLSSGAYMAGQYHLAFAEQIKGAALIAAGPVYCAQNSLGLALEHCFNKASSAPDMNAINSYIQEQQKATALAPASELTNDKVWIFHGSKDATVHPKLGVLLHQQYQQWIAPTNLTLINNKAFGHTFPTDRADLGDCTTSQPPYLASCGYDAAGEFLTHLLGDVKPKSTQITGTLLSINQHQLAPEAADTLAETGYLYVPERCAAGQTCQLHISFHGCKQNAQSVDLAYVSGTGLNNYADTNDLVVLYPQTTASAMNPFNPNACWDWWGYSGADYATRNGKQLMAVQQLVKAIKH